jgi:hypothetical protein
MTVRLIIATYSAEGSEKKSQRDRSCDFVCAFIELRLKVDYTQGHREEINGITSPCQPP